MKVRLWVWTVILGTASVALADPTMTLTDGSASFWLNQPTAETGARNDGDFMVSGADHLWGNWWYYRVGGSSREYSFAGGQFTSSGNTGTYTDWADFAEELFIQIDYTLNSVSALEAHITQRVAVTNFANPVNLDLFNYIDYDLNGTLDDDAATMITLELIEQNLGPILATFEGIGASHWEIDEWNLQLSRFGDANVDNLQDALLTGPGPLDFTAAFQWSNIALGTDQSFTVTEELNVRVPEPATLTLLLLGGFAVGRWRR